MLPCFLPSWKIENAHLCHLLITFNKYFVSLITCVRYNLITCLSIAYICFCHRNRTICMLEKHKTPACAHLYMVIVANFNEVYRIHKIILTRTHLVWNCCASVILLLLSSIIFLSKDLISLRCSASAKQRYVCAVFTSCKKCNKNFNSPFF